MGGAKRRGVDASTLYRRVGIDPARVEVVDARESIESMAALVRAIWIELDDEFMGCTRSSVKRGAFAVMVEYAFASETVLEAIYKGLAFYRVVSNDIASMLIEEGDRVTLEVAFAEPELDPDHYFVEFWLIIWHRLACWLAGETLPLLSAELSYDKPDRYFDEFRRLFPCDLVFNQACCRLNFHRRDLITPIRRSKQEVRDMIDNAPLDLMTIPASDSSVARQVYVALRPWGDGVFTPRSLDEIAQQLNMSSVVMRRALRAEGTSFRQVGEDIRRELACARLRNSQDSVEDIAADVGYLETRSFSRAFRAWTGQSPSEFRRAQRRRE